MLLKTMRYVTFDSSVCDVCWLDDVSSVTSWSFDIPLSIVSSWSTETGLFDTSADNCVSVHVFVMLTSASTTTCEDPGFSGVTGDDPSFSDVTGANGWRRLQVSSTLSFVSARAASTSIFAPELLFVLFVFFFFFFFFVEFSLDDEAPLSIAPSLQPEKCNVNSTMLAS